MIGNLDEEFTKKWYEHSQFFSLSSMSEVISFRGKTIDDVSKDIQTSETKCNQFLRNDKQETIPQAIHKNGKIKVGISSSKKICVICLIESPLKMMKNAFYFILKALFILKIFKFLSRLFSHVRKTPDISQSKGDQTMKFGQLIEYNKRNIFFLQKSSGK